MWWTLAPATSVNSPMLIWILWQFWAILNWIAKWVQLWSNFLHSTLTGYSMPSSHLRWIIVMHFYPQVNLASLAHLQLVDNRRGGTPFWPPSTVCALYIPFLRFYLLLTLYDQTPLYFYEHHPSLVPHVRWSAALRGTEIQPNAQRGLSIFCCSYEKLWKYVHMHLRQTSSLFIFKTNPIHFTDYLLTQHNTLLCFYFVLLLLLFLPWLHLLIQHFVVPPCSLCFSCSCFKARYK